MERRVWWRCDARTTQAFVFSKAIRDLGMRQPKFKMGRSSFESQILPSPRTSHLISYVLPCGDVPFCNKVLSIPTVYPHPPYSLPDRFCPHPWMPPWMLSHCQNGRYAAKGLWSCLDIHTDWRNLPETVINMQNTVGKIFIAEVVKTLNGTFHFYMAPFIHCTICLQWTGTSRLPGKGRSSSRVTRQIERQKM